MNHLIQITKSDGTKQLFEEEKLVSSLKRVGAGDDVIEDIVAEVEKGMYDGMPTSEIYARAFALLKKHSEPVAIKYSIRRALIDLGPDGFPFERFVARIFKTWGYDAVTGQMLKGECVEHEVDVVAWKPGTSGTDAAGGLSMVEAKFHNVFGLKSDLKVALYVKARFDDLAPMRFDYGGAARPLAERWLITNTKFTDRAIAYGTCHQLKMVGWNYPDTGSLHQIIEENGLHPITCLTTLSHEQKKMLVSLGVLVCADLAENLPALHNVGIKTEAQVAAVLAEARAVVGK